MLVRDRMGTVTVLLLRDCRSYGTSLRFDRTRRTSWGSAVFWYSIFCVARPCTLLFVWWTCLYVQCRTSSVLTWTVSLGRAETMQLADSTLSRWQYGCAWTAWKSTFSLSPILMVLNSGRRQVGEVARCAYEMSSEKKNLQFVGFLRGFCCPLFRWRPNEQSHNILSAHVTQCSTILQPVDTKHTLKKSESTSYKSGNISQQQANLETSTERKVSSCSRTIRSRVVHSRDIITEHPKTSEGSVAKLKRPRLAAETAR